ncbi:MAG: TIGR01459 family HAD-type hydrolase [Alphaproteobacteria bacterium]|nr:TIGR01459 family HAD-type hydrolase [Alphaproteobacteria bacterium]
MLSRYQVLLCDVWGVVHNGAAAHEKACDALIEFRRRNGIVILVSNAPVPKFRVQAMLHRVGVPDGIANDIISSGEIALTHIRDAGYKRAFYIGPKDRDAAFFGQSSAVNAPLDTAEAVVCTGLNDDRRDVVEDYRPVLVEALKHKLPFVCANPDLVVDVGGTHFVCAGAIADLYERMGGDVYWAGKPHASAYDAAMASAERVANKTLKKSDAVVIGDALRTDIEGARRYGVDAIFIAGGIHRGDVVAESKINTEKLATLFSSDAPPARAAMVELAW